MSEVSADYVRMIIPTPLSDEEATALAANYADVARGIAACPEDELRSVEPALCPICTR
jgi:hypothetical protein